MKINIQKNIVEFIPERPDEEKNLLEVWMRVVDCVKFNKKLVAVGEYIPEKENRAQFVIEDAA